MMIIADSRLCSAKWSSVDYAAIGREVGGISFTEAAKYLKRDLSTIALTSASDRALCGNSAFLCLLFGGVTMPLSRYQENNDHHLTLCRLQRRDWTIPDPPMTAAKRILSKIIRTSRPKQPSQRKSRHSNLNELDGLICFV